MLPRIQNILCVIGVLMVFCAQTYQSNQKEQQRGFQSKPAFSEHRNQGSPSQEATHRQAPGPIIRQGPSANQQPHVFQAPSQERPAYQKEGHPQQEQGPHVYAVPQSPPVENNRLFHRQHHNHWQPRYNFYDNAYHFYPYVDIASLVELTDSGVSIAWEGQNYFYDQGTFYLQDGSGRYEAVPPPLGIVVPAIPATAHQIVVNGGIFFRCKGVFYEQVAGGYQVVGPVQPVPADA